MIAIKAGRRTGGEGGRKEAKKERPRSKGGRKAETKKEGNGRKEIQTDRLAS